MMPISNIVKKLLILNMVIYVIAHYILHTDALAYSSPQRGGFMPFQIVTHMFMHGGDTHLLFNMIALYFFGPKVEYIWGEKKFLTYYILCGLGSFALFVFVQHFIFHEYIYGLVGASGAIYGILVAFAFLFPKEEIRLIFPPIGGPAPLMVGGFLLIDIFLGVGRYSTGIGHFAHIGGALMGFLILYYFRTKGTLYNHS